jgi:hypothetical protein
MCGSFIMSYTGRSCVDIREKARIHAVCMSHSFAHMYNRMNT